MDPSDTDWGSWSLNDGDDIDAMIDSYQNDESSGDTRPDPLYDTTNTLGDDDDVSADYPMYDGYDSYHENSSLGASDAEDGSVDSFDQAGFGRIKEQMYSSPGLQDGMATCQQCGRTGVKHAFYSKSKRYCSMSCSRLASLAQRDSRPAKKSSAGQPKAHQGKKGSKTPSKSKLSHSPHAPGSGHKDGATFNWSLFLKTTPITAAPVSCFKHCTMADSWDNITVGMKVEVRNTDTDLTHEVFWIATVMKMAGYLVLLRYEGFGSVNSHDFWLNLCTQDVHPVGWCATIGKPLVPPQTIQNKYCDWKDFLVKRLTGARTLPNNFYNKVLEGNNDHKLKPSMKVEVVDKMCVSAMRVATIDEIIGGRLHLQYDDSKEENDEFWCHLKSPLLHPVGWAQYAGHKLHASPEYKSSALHKWSQKKYSVNDSSPEMFPKLKDVSANGLRFQAGMKLEAIDPLNLSTICVATVMKVLRNNYLMIGIDGSMAENGSDWFCYHASSPCIFPVGFCEINNLELTPPRGHKGSFKWFDYLKQTKSVAAPVKLFDKEVCKHGFKVGMKVEAVDLMEPRLICVGTVTRVVGRLLRIHFDGWEQTYDQWIDCASPDIYPVGWCEMVNYHLEGPRTKEAPSPAPSVPKKRKTKNQIYRGPRKKRKAKYQPKGAVLYQMKMEPDSSSLHNSTSGGSFDDVASTPGVEPVDTKPSQPDLTALTVDTSQESKDSSEDSGIPSTESVAGKDMPTLSPPVTTTTTVHNSTDTPPMPLLIDPSNVVTSVADAPPPPAVVTLTATSPTTAQPSITARTGSIKKESLASSLPSISSILGLNNSQSQTSVGSPTLQTAQSNVQKTSPVYTLPSGGNVEQPIPHQVTTTPVPQQSSPFSPATEKTLLPSGGIKSEPQLITQYGMPQLVAHNIPRVIPGEADKDTAVCMTSRQQAITPELWNTFDVCQFLRINDCGAYCDSFSKKGISGRKFLSLTKEQIVNLTGMKVGPSLKIHDLIQQLKVKVASQQQAVPSAGPRLDAVSSSPVPHGTIIS